MFDLIDLRGPVGASRWWYLLPGYLTVWSLVNGAWTFIDGEGLFDAFGIDVTVATTGDEFVLANSGARYLGIGAALVVGIFVVNSAAAAFTALAARLVMDVGDVVAGARTDQFDDVALGVAQSAALFLIPSTISIVWLVRTRQTAERAGRGAPGDGGVRRDQLV
ncbi:MAG: hypothetical protein AAGF73_03935 [Actinomycetota bacterium]